MVSGEVRNLLFSVAKREFNSRHYNILHFFGLRKLCLDLTIKVCCDVASQESDFRYCAFQQFWSSKADWRLRFSLPSIILADLLGNRSSLQRVFKKVMVCDLWLVDFDPFCAFLCFKVRCFCMIVMIIDGSEKRICEGGVWTSEFACFWNVHIYPSQRSKISTVFPYSVLLCLSLVVKAEDTVISHMHGPLPPVFVVDQ